MATAVRINDLTIEELRKIIREEAKNCPPCSEDKPKPKLIYTRQETAELLNVSYATLHNYKKLGILIPRKSNGRTYYLWSDIEAMLRKAA